jgi:ketosteroid isomerase-like protein
MAIDETEFRRVADELAIRDLVARYSDAVIRADAVAWAETWAEDATWKLGPSEAIGRDDIVNTWTTLMGMFDHIRQLTLQGSVQIEGDSASGRWYVDELGWSEQRDTSWVLGVYHDTYARIDREWKFTRRRFDVLHAGTPDLNGANFPFPTDVS